MFATFSIPASFSVRSEIIPNLILTSYSSVHDLLSSPNPKITHILTVAEGLSFAKEALSLHIQYKLIPAEDFEDFNLLEYFDEMTDFIHECLMNQGSIIVHCLMGISRSATAVIAYLIKYKGFTMEEGLKLVKEKRYVARPNEGFLDQLKQYEKLLKKAQKNKENGIKTNDFLKCKNCQGKVVDSKEINHGSEKCGSYFIENEVSERLEVDPNENQVLCQKCGFILGDINTKGSKCSCGKWVPPNYQLHKNKLD